jgi:hypothetical protein
MGAPSIPSSATQEQLPFLALRVATGAAADDETMEQDVEFYDTRTGLVVPVDDKRDES